MAEADRFAKINTLTIRPSMLHDGHHLTKDSPINRRPPIEIQFSADSAH